MCECMQPFTDASEVRIEFETAGARHSYALRLPVVATSFMEPAPLSADDFAQRWQVPCPSQNFNDLNIETVRKFSRVCMFGPAV
jgi:hypothetical protein